MIPAIQTLRVKETIVNQLSLTEKRSKARHEYDRPQREEKTHNVPSKKRTITASFCFVANFSLQSHGIGKISTMISVTSSVAVIL